jgi:ATP-dependent protease HslVU (ClpYQ) peptidase subunit
MEPKKQIYELTQQKLELEEKLKKYTNNKQHIKYYENHKDVVKERAKNYMEKIKESNPEKLKEWRHNAYLKRKENNASQINVTHL